MTAMFQSLRWRLQIWHGLILLLTILALAAAVIKVAANDTYRRVRHSLGQSERELMHGLFDAFAALEPAAAAPPAPAAIREYLRRGELQLPDDTRNYFSSTEAGYIYFIIEDDQGNVLLRSPNAPAGRRLQPAGNTVMEERSRRVGSTFEVLRHNPDGFAILIGRDISAEQSQLVQFSWTVVACGLGAWLVGLLGGWWLAGRAIAPIARIGATAERIAAGDLRERIDTADSDNELDQLARVLNTTFDRLAAAFERQRRFTADAAHELRTPVTILLSETQRMLRREHPVDAYRTSLETCQATAQRMRRLTEALLLLARQEAGGEAVSLTDGDLAPLVHETITHLQPLADERHVILHEDLHPAPCRINPDALSVLIQNLVTNAIQHHHTHGGTVTITTRRTDTGTELTVRDDGPGIPSDDLPHIFTRFHRADTARQGGSPHTGLGLAIAQAIAHNHGGAITATNAPDGGAVFQLTLPPPPANSTSPA